MDNGCCMRRIWVHKISFFVPRPRDVAHPGSGSTQSLLRVRSGWLTFSHPNYHFRQAAAQLTNCFDFSGEGGFPDIRDCAAEGSNLKLSLAGMAALGYLRKKGCAGSEERGVLLGTPAVETADLSDLESIEFYWLLTSFFGCF